MSRPRLLIPRFIARRRYHSPTDAPFSPYTPTESAILASAISHVPQEGFSLTALRSGLHAHGYRDASTALFPLGAYELVLYHLRSQRLSLKDRVQFPSSELGVREKVGALLQARLRGNVEAGVVPRLPQALGLMSLAGNIPSAVEELAMLSDEVWYLAGDVQVDSGWYAKRAGIGAVYASSELFQSQDESTDYKDTEEFLDRRLEETRVLGSAVRDFGEWAEFQGVSMVNLARSWGMRI